MMSWPLLNIGGVGSKSRSLGQILVKPCLHSTGHIFDPILYKLSQNACLDDVLTPIEYGLGRCPKSRSVGQILGKPCLHSTGHSFYPIFIKLSQNVCLDDAFTPIEYRWGQVTRSNLSKILFTLYRPHFWPNLFQTQSECLSWWCLDPYWFWVGSGQKIGH